MSPLCSCSFQSSWFYFETPNRNSSVVGLYLTWQMAGERRSFRLSLSVRWSIPVPIVSLPFSPLEANAKINWIVAICMLLSWIQSDQKFDIFSLSPKVGILLFPTAVFKPASCGCIAEEAVNWRPGSRTGGSGWEQMGRTYSFPAAVDI